MNKNWKDIKNYSFCKKLSRKWWAWEFLRRNKEYQDEWDCASRGNQLPDGRFKVRWWINGYPKLPEGGMALDVNDPNLAIRTSAEQQKRWRIVMLVPPWQDRPDHLFFVEKIEHKLTVEFDLSKSIEPQFDKALRLAKSSQNYHRERGKKIDRPTLPQNHPDLWISYLRILDAKRTGASNGEIAAIIFPEEEDEYPEYKPRKRVSDRLKKANILTDKGYHDIAFPYGW